MSNYDMSKSVVKREIIKQQKCIDAANQVLSDMWDKMLNLKMMQKQLDDDGADDEVVGHDRIQNVVKEVAHGSDPNCILCVDAEVFVANPLNQYALPCVLQHGNTGGKQCMLKTGHHHTHCANASTIVLQNVKRKLS